MTTSSSGTSSSAEPVPPTETLTGATTPADPAILEHTVLGAPPWVTVDPYLFCVHHDDASHDRSPQPTLPGDIVRQQDLNFRLLGYRHDRRALE